MNRETTLTAWFKLNQTDDFAKNILYIDIPEYCTFSSNKKWIRRKNHCNTLGRLVCVLPKEQELFHLKLILHRVKGAKSFDDLKKFEGMSYSSFTETAIAMGLVENDKEIFNAFDEACSTMFPHQLRSYFAWYLMINKLSLAKIIWEKYKTNFCEDFMKNGDSEIENKDILISTCENLARREIENIINSENCTAKILDFPNP